jgi:hypothetical protein
LAADFVYTADILSEYGKTVLQKQSELDPKYDAMANTALTLVDASQYSQE